MPHYNFSEEALEELYGTSEEPASASDKEPDGSDYSADGDDSDSDTDTYEPASARFTSDQLDSMAQRAYQALHAAGALLQGAAVSKPSQKVLAGRLMESFGFMENVDLLPDFVAQAGRHRLDLINRCQCNAVIKLLHVQSGDLAGQ